VLPRNTAGAKNKESVMLKTFSLAVVALAGLAGSAVAAVKTVEVNITVDPIVSLWASHNAVSMTMVGNAENAAIAQSSINIMNNVSAAVKVYLSGYIPEPSEVTGSGGGMYFHIFKESLDLATVRTRMGHNNNAGNAYAPQGALSWNYGNLSDIKDLYTTTDNNFTAENIPITYAISSPGDLPPQGNYTVVVNYEITPTN
jgi:hypothetical protein